MSDLIIGAARIYTGESSAALPTLTDLAALEADTFTGFSYLGDTTSALTFTDTPTIVEAKSQQSTRSLDSAITDYQTMLATTLRGIDLAELAARVNGTVAGNGVVPANTKGSQRKFAVAVVAPWNDGETLLLTASRVAYEGEFSLDFNSEDFSAVPVSIKIHSGAAGQQDYYIDTTVPTP